uniref:Uncharacterized protein n=1 Tax=Tetradesmus obliquus TaxID=3088 RepID=A0A383W5G7_TETOB
MPAAAFTGTARCRLLGLHAAGGTYAGRLLVALAETVVRCLSSSSSSSSSSQQVWRRQQQQVWRRQQQQVWRRQQQQQQGSSRECCYEPSDAELRALPGPCLPAAVLLLKHCTAWRA